MLFFGIYIEHAILYHSPNKLACVVYGSFVGITWHNFLEFLDRNLLPPCYGILRRVNVFGGSGFRFANREDAFCHAYNCGVVGAEQFCRSGNE